LAREPRLEERALVVAHRSRAWPLTRDEPRERALARARRLEGAEVVVVDEIPEDGCSHAVGARGARHVGVVDPAIEIDGGVDRRELEPPEEARQRRMRCALDLVHGEELDAFGAEAALPRG